MTTRSDSEAVWTSDPLSLRTPPAKHIRGGMLPPAIVDAVGRALGGLRARHSAHLRSLVADLVTQMKGEGVAPERVIVLLKEAVRSAEAVRPADEPPPPRESIDRRDALMHDVVAWCIADYYREP